MSDVIPWIAPLVLFLALAWVTVLVAAPLLPAAPAGIAYAVGSLICHQLADRSFHLGAVQLPVCARCLGIYGGFVVAVTAAFSRLVPGSAFARLMDRHRGLTPDAARWMVGVGAAPTAITVIAEWGGVWQTSNAARFAAGLPLGSAVGVVVIAALATLHYGECARRPPITSDRPPSRI